MINQGCAVSIDLRLFFASHAPAFNGVRQIGAFILCTETASECVLPVKAFLFQICGARHPENIEGL